MFSSNQHMSMYINYNNYNFKWIIYIPTHIIIQNILIFLNKTKINAINVWLL